MFHFHNTLGSTVTFIAAIGALFLACGMLVTLVMSRIVGAPLKPIGFSLACLASLVLSSLTASLAVAALGPPSCSGENCAGSGGWGLMDGGLALVAIWLFVYSVAYVVVALAFAKYQVHKSRAQ